MTDHDKARALIAEAMADSSMLEAFREFGDSYLIRTKHGAYGTHAVVVVLERERALADGYEAALAEIGRLLESVRAAGENWMSACKQRDEARAEVERLRSSLQQWRADIDDAHLDHGWTVTTRIDTILKGDK